MKQWMASLALFLAIPVLASCQSPPNGHQGAPDRLVLNDPGFLRAHPDLKWRKEGMIALNDERAGEAFTFFRRSARYADKASQAMMAEMLWMGTGVPVDRPRAYAWMDIAAERAYVPFVAKREEYWKALTADERAKALEVGRPLYAEYRDAVAKERLERKLKKAKRKITGSRTGFVGFLRIVIPGPGGVPIDIDAERFYDDTYWEPDQYWAWQDTIWKDPPTGTVSVDELEVVRGDEDGERDGE